jgi:4'-phosphopantetheinyl transferase
MKLKPALWAFDPMIALSFGEIHLWLTTYSTINDEWLHTSYRALLDDAERQQEIRFYFSKDRRRYLVTRALVRTVLSRYLPILPKDWIFSNNAYGRPEINNAQAIETQLFFNISHTDSLIVLALARGRALGVDVENVLAREISTDIADRFFAPDEVRSLFSSPIHQRQYRFFEYWTFKESYIKARGMGLSIPLDKFGFYFPRAGAVEIEIDATLADDAARWQFWQFQPSREYLIAVCAERLTLLPPKLLVMNAIPMVMQETVTPRFLRTSDATSLFRNNTP